MCTEEEEEEEEDVLWIRVHGLAAHPFYGVYGALLRQRLTG